MKLHRTTHFSGFIINQSALSLQSGILINVENTVPVTKQPCVYIPVGDSKGNVLTSDTVVCCRTQVTIALIKYFPPLLPNPKCGGQTHFHNTGGFYKLIITKKNVEEKNSSFFSFFN